MNEIKVPGKLFIAGEYAAMSVKYHAILVPVNRYLSATIEPITEKLSIIRSNEQELKLDFINWPNQLVVNTFWNSVVSAVQISRNWLLQSKIQLKNFSLVFHSELEDPKYGKIGLGSSGAVTIATIKSILSLFQIELSKKEIFQLGIKAQKGSFETSSYGDIAVATFQKPLYYQKPKIIGSPAKFETFSWPSKWRLLVGFTGHPFDTLEGVKKFELLSLENKVSFCQKVERLTSLMYRDLQKGTNPQGIFQQICDLYWNFDQEQQIGVFTPTLKMLVLAAREFNIPAKQSGAGGGDCGIAIVKKGAETPLIERWKREGIIPLNLEVVD